MSLNVGDIVASMFEILEAMFAMVLFSKIAGFVSIYV